jgi:hypothetical protein
MDLKGIVGLKGKGGLFKIISSKEAKIIIVEALDDNKRFPVPDPYGISQLESITVFGQGEDLRLSDIFKNIKSIESEHPVPDPKGDDKAIITFFKLAAPDYDVNKVYTSHIKKMLSWYIILNEKHYFDEPDTNTESAPSETDSNN